MNGSNTLEYSCCNEDSQSELRALQPAGRRILSIAAAGGRAFSLLLGDPAEVVAIDVNPYQIHLCRLKYQALRRLDRDEYLRFVGVEPAGDRPRVYKAIRNDLPAGTRAFWDRRPEMIKGGILYCGRFDRHVISMARFFLYLGHWPVQRLGSFTTLEEQAKYLSPWRLAMWAVIFKFLFNPLVSRAMHLNVGSKGHRREAGAFFADRVETYLRTNLFRDSHLLQLFTQGRLRRNGPLPLHLQAGNYELVRQRLDRLSFQRSDVSNYLAKHNGHAFDAFSLSDVGSYLGAEQMATLLAKVERAGSPGALICLREYVAPLGEHSAWPATFQRDARLEEELGRADSCMGYTFVCAKVVKYVN